jgi:hypothetical protein
MTWERSARLRGVTAPQTRTAGTESASTTPSPSGGRNGGPPGMVHARLRRRGDQAFCEQMNNA